jgi:hypothetical protein
MPCTRLGGTGAQAESLAWRVLRLLGEVTPQASAALGSHQMLQLPLFARYAGDVSLEVADQEE